LFETKLAFNAKRQPTDYMLKHVKKTYNIWKKHSKSQGSENKNKTSYREIERVHTWGHCKQMLQSLDVACAWD